MIGDLQLEVEAIIAVTSLAIAAMALADLAVGIASDSYMLMAV